MRRFRWLVAVLSFVFILCFSVSGFSSPTVLKLGFVTAPNPKDPYYITAKKFADLIKEYTHGRYVVRLYGSGQLGNERDMVNNLIMGTMDLGVITNAPVGTFVHAFMILDMPFLFPNAHVAHKVLDGPAGELLLKQLRKIHVVGLAFAEGGFRDMINNVRPIYSVKDLKGIKFRVMRSPVYIAMFRALGANAVPMPWPEVFTAVQEKVVDGLEIPVPVIYSNKFFEVTKYLSLTQHTYSPLIVMCSGSLWKRLSKSDRRAFKRAAVEAVRYERKKIESIVNEYISLLKEKGMKINNVPDKKPFQEAVKPVYREFENKIGRRFMETVLKARDEAEK